MTRVYKQCVVGHGMMGTAASKYLAKAGEDVVLVGPSEGKNVHGACYDEGRIYRILDPRKCWATLAEKSIQEYPRIAAESGVDFFQETGLLIWGVQDDFIRQTLDVAARMHTPLLHMRPDDIALKYPWLGIPAEVEIGLLQEKNAGHMSPRKLNLAQLKLAKASGATHIDLEVTEVVQKTFEDYFAYPSPRGHHVSMQTDHACPPVFTVKTSGEEVLAHNVLVAAGCYTSLLPLLPEKLVLSLTGSQALLFEISGRDAQLLAKMPSMIYEGNQEEDCFYLLPPIRYPDGKWLLKIGPSTAFAPPLKTTADADAWFSRCACDAEFEAKAKAVFSQFFPSIGWISTRPLLCITDQTATLNPYVDMLAPGWAVCSGGNGWAAKSSDAIGSLAADMMRLPQHWSPDPLLPRDWFRAITPQGLEPTERIETALASVNSAAEVMLNRVYEALQVVTHVLAKEPLLRVQSRFSIQLQMQLADVWGFAPTVFCVSASGNYALGHPHIVIRVDPHDIVVVLPS